MTASAWAFRAGYRFTRAIVLQLFDFGFDGRDIGIPGFLEHIALQWRQGFAFGTETDALVVGQFVRQRGDFDIFGMNDGIFRLDDLRAGPKKLNNRLSEKPCYF